MVYVTREKYTYVFAVDFYNAIPVVNPQVSCAIHINVLRQNWDEQCKLDSFCAELGEALLFS